MQTQNDSTPNKWHALPPTQPTTAAHVWNPHTMRIEPATWNGRVWISPEGTMIHDAAYWMQPRPKG
jgi:hypothetical protein